MKKFFCFGMCANLKMKDKRDYFRYRCSLHGAMRDAPQYCASYKLREEDGNEQ